MDRQIVSRFTAMGLSLALLAFPSAQALTTEQAAELLRSYYIDEVPENVLEQPTVKKMLDALGDPYTEYFTASDYTSFTSSMEDTTLVGIGITYTNTEEGLLLGDVIAGGPAEKGGMKAGDLIVAVDGKDVLSESDADTVTGWIRGEEGSKVKITYRRDNTRRTVTLTRALVVIPATSGKLLNGHIGYIDCDTFGEETYNHFREALDTYGDEADTWIVDLRSNLGGVTDAAVNTAGLFVGEGPMLYFRDGNGEYEYCVSEETAATDAPVLVLVDGYTASAAEIFAAALQSYGRGIILGERTFGKGVAQTVFTKRSFPDYFAEGDALKITSHRFFSPAGNTTDQVGVIPDLLMDSDTAADVALLLAENTLENGCRSLRVRFCGEVWRIDLDHADPDTLQALLETLPVGCETEVELGDGWTAATTEEVAALMELEIEPTGFTDSDRSRFSEALAGLKTYGFIRGVGDGSFHPQDSLTRAELCQILATALNCVVPQNGSSYADVDDSAWYAPAVTAVSNIGLMKGVGNDLFLPEEPVDHEQLITVMGRLGQRLNMFVYEDAAAMPEDAVKQETFAEYSAWARPSVWLLSESQEGYFGNELNLLWDSPENIEPTAPTTREEAAFLLYRLLTHIEILPPSK